MRVVYVCIIFNYPLVWVHYSL